MLAFRARAETMGRVTQEQVESFARLALDGIGREFPNKPGHLLTGPESLRTPRELHPVFFGCFDWHSAVHGHWMLVRLLRCHPGAPVAGEIRRALGERFRAEELRAEAAYFGEKENRSFERMYGWAWALRLATELRGFDDPDARRWAERCRPLEQAIVGLAKDYLPRLDWPVRCGFHPESAFPLAQMIDHARATGDAAFEGLLLEKARQFYRGDRDYPVRYEPSGNDFFSAGLNEADLMRRVLEPGEFPDWLDGFLPALGRGECGKLLTPVRVSDLGDGQLVHLAGLNLSRAWAMRGIASVLDGKDPRRAVLEESAAAHSEAGLARVATGHYEGDHWLASFAVYLLSEVGIA